LDEPVEKIVTAGRSGAKVVTASDFTAEDKGRRARPWEES